MSRKDYGVMSVTSTSGKQSVEHDRSLPQSLKRGAIQRCPACGSGALFKRYLKVADQCPSCSEELHHHRADDAPPYFTPEYIRGLAVERGSRIGVEYAEAFEVVREIR